MAQAPRPHRLPPNEPGERDRREGNQLLAGGTAIGAIGLLTTALAGTACPLCVVAAPALLGAGLYRRVRGERLARSAAREALEPPARSEAGPRRPGAKRAKSA